MDNSVVRILEVELQNFKNTKYGQAKTPMDMQKDIFSTTGDILGIYGQNGSGKTSIIEAMTVVQTLLQGKELPSEAVHYISKDATDCTIAVTFAVQINNIKSTVVYRVNLMRQSIDTAVIQQESIGYKLWSNEKPSGLKQLYITTTESEIVVSPQTRYQAIVSANKNVRTDLLVAHKLAQSQHLSYLFSKEAIQILADENDYEFSPLLVALRHFAFVNLFVITNANAGYISSSYAMPMIFRMKDDYSIKKGSIAISLREPSVITQEKFELVQSILDHMNTVLCQIVPGLTIQIHDFGEQLTNDGIVGRRIELLSQRGENTIPLRCESEGILKIISILHVLMGVYQHANITVLIDELDAGIYEYLLGELLLIFEKGAKGQLIFTSHNLRALEMLHKNSILFSTNNPENRYVRMYNVKNSHNLRDTYLRTIFLGGATEELYAKTDTTAISRAFYQAGEERQHGEC